MSSPQTTNESFEWSSTSTTTTTTTSILFAILSAFLALAWTGVLRPWLERRRPHPTIPVVPGSHWLVGHLFWFIRLGLLAKQQALADHADDQGRCSVWMGFLPSISLSTPSDAKKLLWNHHARHSPPFLTHHLKRLVGPKNLLTMNGREWKTYRSALGAGLAKVDPSDLRAMVADTTNTLTQSLAAKIKRSQTTSIAVDSIHCLMKMVFVDVFGRSAFSHDFGCCASLELCSFARDFEFLEKDVVDRCRTNTLYPPNFFYRMPTKRNATFERHRSRVRNVLRTIIDERRNINSNSNSNGRVTKPPPRDILQSILEAHKTTATNTKTENAELSDDDLIDLLLSILLAGYETVSTTLTYALYLIAKHPDWEAKCLEEIRRATSNNSSSNNSSSSTSSNHHRPNGPAVEDLPTCRGVVLEALRLYPVATGTSRTLEHDLVLDDGVVIPKGYHAGVSFWAIHRSERWFPEPHAFRPDRWTTTCDENKDENENENKEIPKGNTDAFWAFAGGARVCPGRRFALHEATLALAGLIRDLEFRVDPSLLLTEPELEWKAVVQCPKGGIPATVVLRNGRSASASRI